MSSKYMTECKDGQWECNRCKQKFKYQFEAERCRCWENKKTKRSG